jgi:hypothetical protein
VPILQVLQFRVLLVYPTSRCWESCAIFLKSYYRLTVGEYMLVKPILLTQNFQKYPRASVSQACNLRAERANQHACDTLSARLPRQFPLAPSNRISLQWNCSEFMKWKGPWQEVLPPTYIRTTTTISTINQFWS